MASRNELLRILHATARDQGLGEDAYRDKLYLVSGARSAKQLDDAQLATAVDKFRAKPSSASHAYLAKPKALFIACYNLGAFQEGDDAALDAFVKHQTGKDRLAFLTPVEAGKVTEGLKQIAARHGFIVPDHDEGGMRARQALLYAQWKRMGDVGLTRIADSAALDRYVTKAYLSHTGGVIHLKRQQCDEQSKQFGRRIRGALAAKREAGAA